MAPLPAAADRARVGIEARAQCLRPVRTQRDHNRLGAALARRHGQARGISCTRCIDGHQDRRMPKANEHKQLLNASLSKSMAVMCFLTQHDPRRHPRRDRAREPYRRLLGCRRHRRERPADSVDGGIAYRDGGDGGSDAPSGQPPVPVSGEHTQSPFGSDDGPCPDRGMEMGRAGAG